MGDNLEKVGVRAVVEGASPFSKALDGLNKKIGDFHAKTQAAAKGASPLDKALNKLGVSVDGLRQRMLEMSGASGNITNALTQILGALGPLGLAIAAVTAAVAGFIALGVRGASLRGLAESFDLLTASVGVLSNALLKDLRQAAAGTISDFELIRQANFALAGATGEFGRMFAENLPRVLEIARAQARATGQDVGYLFNSLVIGIKRGSPLMIDNTGIVLKLTQTYREYAEELGITVEQLTTEQKQIALLNATLEAGQGAIDQAATIQETAAEKMARAGATISNILDKLALAVQPAFEAVLDIVNRVLTAIDTLVTVISPVITAIVNFLVQPLLDAGRAIMDFFEPIIRIIQMVAPYVIAAVQMIGDAIAALGSIFSTAGDTIEKETVSPILNAAKFFSSPETRRAFFFGAARMIGALASGIMQAANQYVFPAILSIARFIADFLMGLSPPPMGPLSTIDQGGANVMTAWLDGILGVSLDPVKKVAADVAAALGSIGKMSREQVEARLLQLDAALQPFADRLDIVKAQFDALREPAEAALRAVDRQLEQAVQALAQGDEQAAASVRALDAQRAAIEAALEGQQEMIDAAQLQFALAKAQQAQERTLLEIRKRMLGPAGKVIEAITGKGKKAPGAPKAPKAPEVGGGAPTPAPVGGADIGLPPGEGTDVLDLIGGQGAVDEAKLILQEGFEAGLDPAVVGEFQSNVTDLQTELGRIGSVDVGQKLRDRFDSLFNPDNPESIPGKIVDWIKSIVDPSREQSVPWFFNVGLPREIENARASLETAVQTAFASVVTFFTGTGEGTLAGMFLGVTTAFQNLPLQIIEAIGDLGETLFTGETAPFRPLIDFFTGTEIGGIWDAIHGPLGILMLFGNLPTDLVTTLENLADTLFFAEGAPFRGVIDFLTGSEENTIQNILNRAVTFFSLFPQNVVGALIGFGRIVWDAIAVPVITAVNGLITAVEGALNSLKTAAAQVLDEFSDVFDFVISLTPAAGHIPSGHDMAALLRGSRISLPRFSADPPAFLTGAATGGVFGKGMLRVGERGSELLSSASRMAVFPHEFVRSMDALTGVMQQIVAQPAPMPIPAGNSYNSTDASMTNIFNGVNGSRDAMARLRTTQAYRRGRR